MPASSRSFRRPFYGWWIVLAAGLSQFVAVGNEVAFVAGSRLFFTDGTAAGTREVPPQGTVTYARRAA